MPKTRKEEGGLGDWSSTGTFLRKPSSGWLHGDHELQDQSSINYKIKYLGCIEVCQSMRILQYNMRTQVTKEAIARMAESAGRLLQGKRKKVPKQLNRLLGEADTRWAGEVNLAVSAESLRISSATSNREIMNHALPSISFASGGDGPTIDFIGYVAKDPVHERACHVFECVQCSQYVLTTIGQAFELRYKMYLNSPHPEPLQIRNTIRTGDSWLQSANITHEDKGATPLQGEPPYSPTPGAGIYSDLPEFPSDGLPSPTPCPSSKELPPLTTISGPRVYSQLPGFPTVVEDNEPRSNGTAEHSRLDNPYDTIHTSRFHRDTPLFPPTGVYSEPGEITSSCEETNYGTRMMTIKQSPMTSANSELIDLTPPLDQPNHIYSNTVAGIHNGTAASPVQTKVSPPPKSRPLPRPLPRPVAKKRIASSSSSSGSSEVIYDDPTGSLSAVKPPPSREVASFHCNDYDDPDALHASISPPPPTVFPSPHHTPPLPPFSRSPGRRPCDDYDDIQEVIAAKPKKRSSPPPLVPKPLILPLKQASKGGHNSGRPKPEPRGPPRSRGPPPNLPPPVYDDPNTLIHRNGFGGRGRIAEDGPSSQGKTSRTRTPKFDDTIYAIRQDVGIGGEEEEEEERGRGAGRNSAVSHQRGEPAAPHPDPLAPLPFQHYYHGRISRVEAEALLESDGEFLVRESTKIEGQFVLSGMALGGAQHLLLMDKAGKVKSRDHEFDSVPHLVDYFTTRDIPLVIGKSQVFLRQPVVNAFPNGRGQ